MKFTLPYLTMTAVSIAVLSGPFRALAAQAPSVGAQGQAAPPSPAQSSRLDSARLQLERDRFDFQQQVERRQLELEERRLANERRNSSLESWKVLATTVAVFIPLLVVVWTVRSQLRLANLNRSQEVDRARANFQIKAAELVFASRSPGQARRRAALLESVYHEWIPAGSFTSKDELARFPGYMYDQKMELLRLMAAAPDRQGDTARIYALLFPDEAKEITNLEEFTTPSVNPIQVSTPRREARVDY